MKYLKAIGLLVLFIALFMILVMLMIKIYLAAGYYFTVLVGLVLAIIIFAEICYRCRKLIRKFLAYAGFS